VRKTQRKIPRGSEAKVSTGTASANALAPPRCWQRLNAPSQALEPPAALTARMRSRRRYCAPSSPC